MASKAWVKKHGVPKSPAELDRHAVVAYRSPRTGKRRAWVMRDRSGATANVDPEPQVLLSEVDAVESAVALGAGIALLPTSQVLPGLENGSLVRVLPSWWADGGPMLVYHASQRLLPARVRVFIDMLVAHFKAEKLAQRFRADR